MFSTSTPAGPRAAYSHRRRSQHPLARLVTVLALAVAGFALAAAPAHAQPPPTPQPGCVRHDVAVTLTADPGAPSYRLAGWMCQPAHPSRTVQLLLPGLTYTHQFWTGLSARTDYTGAALAAGNAVYLIDRIGTGASDRPPADQVTTSTEATVTHQVVHALRDGVIGRFSRIVGVGHSYGSVIWMAEAAEHHDVDALVLTGLLHDIRTDAMTQFVTSLYPAAGDPKFAAAAPPHGYLTTRPGSRATYFLDPRTAVPGAAGWDEQAKTTATSGELTFTPSDEVAYSRAITAPVLLVMGTHDDLFCDATLPCGTGVQLCEREHSDYAAGAALFAATIPDAGHSINLHRNAGREFAIANDWLAHPTGQFDTRRITSCRS